MGLSSINCRIQIINVHAIYLIGNRTIMLLYNRVILWKYTHLIRHHTIQNYLSNYSMHSMILSILWSKREIYSFVDRFECKTFVTITRNMRDIQRYSRLSYLGHLIWELFITSHFLRKTHIIKSSYCEWFNAYTHAFC